MRVIIVSALAVSLAATAAAAQPTRYVDYGDLDLSSPAGRSTLRQRVTTAVEQACGPIEVRNIHSGPVIEACRTDTWAMVQPQLDAAFGGSVEFVADARIAIRRKDAPRR